MDIKSAIMQEFDQEMQNTRKALERFPDGKSDWKPHPKSMSLGRLAGHITDFPNWAFHTLSANQFEVPADYKPFVPQTQSELLEHFDKNLAEARDALAKANLESFDETWTLKYGGKVLMSMPKAAVMRGMVMNHMVHHRGQLSVYLRLLDIPVPGMYGASADEPQNW